MAGRKNKPKAIKLIEGNRGKRRLKNEPKFEPALIPCPTYLESDEIAKEEWNRIVPELNKLGLLTSVDKATLELYCTQYSIYRQALEKLDQEGLLTKNIRNGDKANPAAAIAREAAKIIKSVAVEFGFTPSSRGRIDIKPPSLDDEFEKMLIEKGR